MSFCGVGCVTYLHAESTIYIIEVKLLRKTNINETAAHCPPRVRSAARSVRGRSIIATAKQELPLSRNVRGAVWTRTRTVKHLLSAV